jgi:hypothetical protein
LAVGTANGWMFERSSNTTAFGSSSNSPHSLERR